MDQRTSRKTLKLSILLRIRKNPLNEPISFWIPTIGLSDGYTIGSTVRKGIEICKTTDATYIGQGIPNT
jgi:hypothetical protein